VPVRPTSQQQVSRPTGDLDDEHRTIREGDRPFGQHPALGDVLDVDERSRWNSGRPAMSSTLASLPARTAAVDARTPHGAP